MFPPFCYLLKLTCRRASSASAERAAKTFAVDIATKRLGIAVDGPAPAFHEKSQGKFAWQLVLKTKNRRALIEIINTLPSGWSYDIDPLHLT
jgi:primosomal protein N'